MRAYLDHLCGGPGQTVLLDDVIKEHDFGQLHGDVILVGAGLQVGYHRWPYAQRRDGKALKFLQSYKFWQILIYPETSTYS